MNCVEFQEFLPEIIEGDHSGEQEQHLQFCSECSGIFHDLQEISRTGKLLQAADEPSPRVWNSIEIALRQEGIIREPKVGPVLVPPSSHRWKLAWLVPLAALLVLVSEVVLHQRATEQPSVLTTSAGLQPEDEQLLQEVAERAPAMRATYATDLRNVNSYIRAAQESVKNDPNDEDARQSLIEAYDQRSMVYAMALERTLP